MKFYLQRLIISFFCVGLLSTCSKNNEKKFRLIPSSESGITFRNTLKESVEFNLFNYMYFYNGAGVAAGDVNGDGLPDIYFTSNQEDNKLYLNLGGFKFKDITELAGVAGFNGWCTGVTMADVNNDGRLDIYVSYLGDYLIYKGKNQLFINQGPDKDGVPKFSDQAVEYGLDLVGFSTQASFFDYDRDGDLDMFMLNHSLHQNGTFGKSDLRNEPHALAGDRLLKNDNGRFIDVTQGSGIYNSVLGYGLGVVVSDINMDGWPDLYVGNDFHENDYLYLNQGNGTFKETLESSMNHTSRYTMGVDFADFNNDAFPDLIAMDMLPEDPYILKASAAEDAFDVYQFKLNYGYNHQFARNTMQLNNQNGTFSEIALMSGVSATDWSWSSLFADFDLDGHKDIFITNGIYRRSNDLDYINFITIDSIQAKMTFDMTDKELKYIDKMPKIKLPNYLYINNRDSTFTNQALNWGLEKPSYSNGAAYADLDNDGDLDLVMNNVEDEAFIYENKTISNSDDGKKENSPHYLNVSLHGKTGNRFGIGAKVFVYDQGKIQMQECMPTRGYESSVDYKLVFGVGTENSVDSVLVIWNVGSFQKIKDVRSDQTLQLDEEKAGGVFNYERLHPKSTIFTKANSLVSIPYKHAENTFIEFNREATIPHMVSREGPAASIGDLNNDGLDDIYLGGAKREKGHTFIQNMKGNFVELRQPAIDIDSVSEDVYSVFFDADNDKDIDLLVISGGNEFAGRSPHMMPRLYLNDGKAVFERAKNFPEIFMNGSCATIIDIDRDGDDDIFIGARSIPWRYGVKPDSYFLINDGKGNYTDATETVAPFLRKFGLVKSCSAVDIDADGDKDLVVAGEWMPVTILLNEKGRLKQMPLENSGLEKSNGWWNFFEAYDFDNDGDMDLVGGNLGLNSKLKASVQEPVKLFVNDFDKNDSVDQVLTHFINGKEYPFYTRDEMTKQLPYLKKKFLSYHKFAEAGLHDLFDEETLNAAEKYEAYTFETSYIENLGNLKFKIKPLPKAAQISTINAIVVDDFDHDRQPDMLLAGNFYPINIQMGRYDASYGLFLKGKGKEHFNPVPAVNSGFSISGETRALKTIKVGNKIYYLAIRNDDTIEVFTLK